MGRSTFGNMGDVSQATRMFLGSLGRQVAAKNGTRSARATMARTSRRTKRSKRRTSGRKKRARGRSRGAAKRKSKLKFGSPAWRKKYVKR